MTIYRFILITALLCTGGNSFGQWVVFDGSNMAQGIVNTTRQITESSKIVSNTLVGFEETAKIYEQGREYYDALKSVNNYVRDARKVQQSLLMASEITEIYVKNYGEMLADDNFHPVELETIAQGYNKILIQSSDLVSDLKFVVTPSTVSMSDKERIDLINKVYTDMAKMKGFTEYYTRKFIGISNIRSVEKGESEMFKSLYGSDEQRNW